MLWAPGTSLLVCLLSLAGKTQTCIHSQPCLDTLFSHFLAAAMVLGRSRLLQAVLRACSLVLGTLGPVGQCSGLPTSAVWLTWASTGALWGCAGPDLGSSLRRPKLVPWSLAWFPCCPVVIFSHNRYKFRPGRQVAGGWSRAGSGVLCVTRPFCPRCCP